jgi:hypothetical protein
METMAILITSAAYEWREIIANDGDTSWLAHWEREQVSL